jgi:hypothetical protein
MKVQRITNPYFYRLWQFPKPFHIQFFTGIWKDSWTLNNRYQGFMKRFMLFINSKMVCYSLHFHKPLVRVHEIRKTLSYFSLKTVYSRDNVVALCIWWSDIRRCAMFSVLCVFDSFSVCYRHLVFRLFRKRPKKYYKKSHKKRWMSRNKSA